MTEHMWEQMFEMVTDDEQLRLGVEPQLMSKVDLNIFYQDKEWRDSRGYTWKLSQMTDSHLENLVVYFHNNAKRFYAIVLTGVVRKAPDKFVDMVCMDEDFILESADGWLHDTPLYKAVMKEIDKRYPYMGATATGEGI